MIAPPYLQEGDKAAIVCPASKLSAPIQEAIELFQFWGLQVTLGGSVGASFHRFSGKDDLRAADLQRFLYDQTVKDVIAARGGYGTIRILNKIDFPAGHVSDNRAMVFGRRSHLNVMKGVAIAAYLPD